MSSNNPYANILGGVGGSLLPQQSGTASLNQVTGSHTPTGMSGLLYPYQASLFPPTTMPVIGTFRIEKIANGFLVHLVRYEGGILEILYAEDFKAAGELITAKCVQWEIDGKK